MSVMAVGSNQLSCRNGSVAMGQRSTSRRVLWALLDQCVISGGNFATNLILARHLPPSEFGVYVLVLNAILFANTIHAASVTTPMFIKGARFDRKQLRRMLTGGLVATLLLSIPNTGILTGACVSVHRYGLILPACLALFFWQSQEALRTSFIAHMDQRRAIAGDAISYLGQAFLIFAMVRMFVPTNSMIFVVIAATSLLGGCTQFAQLPPSSIDRSALRHMLGEMWLMGRWNILARILGFFTALAFPWVILIHHGTIEVAGFQSIVQMLTLTNPLTFSLGSLITASIAGSKDRSISHAKPYIALIAGIVGAYLVCLSATGTLAFRLFYGHTSPYVVYAPLLRAFTLAWALDVIGLIASTVLTGREQMRELFQVQGCGAIVAILIAFPWIYISGVSGAVHALIVVNGLRAAYAVALLLSQSQSAISIESRSSRFSLVGRWRTAGLDSLSGRSKKSKGSFPKVFP